MDHALATFGSEVAIAFSGAEDVALIEYAHLTGRPYRVFRCGGAPLACGCTHAGALICMRPCSGALGRARAHAGRYACAGTHKARCCRLRSNRDCAQRGWRTCAHRQSPPPLPPFSLDTGRLNPETYQLFDAVEKHYNIHIE